jgi:hypothetical protein
MGLQASGNGNGIQVLAGQDDMVSHMMDVIRIEILAVSSCSLRFLLVLQVLSCGNDCNRQFAVKWPCLFVFFHSYLLVRVIIIWASSRSSPIPHHLNQLSIRCCHIGRRGLAFRSFAPFPFQFSQDIIFQLRA